MHSAPAPSFTPGADQLWKLVFGQPQIDPTTLAGAIELEIQRQPLDFRTRLLIRDAASALRDFWGEQRYNAWRQRTRGSDQLAVIESEDLGPPGFTLLRERLVDTTKRETVLQLLRELGQRMSVRERLVIGDSIALILANQLARHTDDIDVVDELPGTLRNEHALLDELAARFGLRLAHFQSHYLPMGWESRTQPLGGFGHLDVFIVDALDVAVSKLFSVRSRDLDDLRALAPQIDREPFHNRVVATGAALMNEGQLRANATRNWYIIFGDELPLS